MPTDFFQYIFIKNVGKNGMSTEVKCRNTYLNSNLCSQRDLTKVSLHMRYHLVQIGIDITGISVEGAVIVNL